MSDSSPPKESNQERAAQLEWQAVLKDFENDARHQRFIQFCLKRHLLHFAAQQYNAYLADHPNDVLATSYLQQVKQATLFMIQTSSIRPNRSFRQRMMTPAYLILFLTLLIFFIGLVQAESGQKGTLLLSLILVAINVGYFGLRAYQNLKSQK